jgi:hypothetical protein
MRGRQMDLSGSVQRKNFKLLCTWSRNVDFLKMRGIFQLAVELLVLQKE